MDRALLRKINRIMLTEKTPRRSGICGDSGGNVEECRCRYGQGTRSLARELPLHVQAWDRIDVLASERRKRKRRNCSPVNHNYVIHERPVDPHDASVLVEQVLDRRDVTVPR